MLLWSLCVIMVKWTPGGTKYELYQVFIHLSVRLWTHFASQSQQSELQLCRIKSKI